MKITVEMWTTRGKSYFHRRARNGKIVEPSQGYSTPSNCRRAIRRRYPDAEVKIVKLEKRPR